MSAHKNIDRICCAVLALVFVLTVMFMNGEALGLIPTASALGYEDRIFDTSRVHTVDIVMDGWETFLETAENEEYASCSVVIDGEAYKNVAIRAKGNTSLSSVRQYGNDRYSFKIEFDHYDSGSSYYGLDKLVLNNLIQDNTMMKDYLVYQMMLESGAAAPLCSFVYITVNGEDFGLYLAIEAVEDSFLRRNYGSSYGNLYKPDGMNMGGGRAENNQRAENSEMPDFMGNAPTSGAEMPQNGGETSAFPPEMPTDMGISSTSEDLTEFTGEISGFMGNTSTSGEGSAAPQGNAPNVSGNAPTDMGNPPTSERNAEDRQGRSGFGGMMGSGGALLSYTDDSFDSYSVIFDSAKTDIDDSDKARLIASLKDLGNMTNLENVLDIEALMRYFAVHNFVLNFDSYTGSMIHNYYLYEENGKLSMLPWDYNLAFGSFQGGADAEEYINYPIDEPTSGSDTSLRPMLAWIFANDEYKEMYYAYLDAFVSGVFESGRFTEIIDSAHALIAPYVEKDPTKFCTYEEFENGVETLREFCLRRAESVRGQLDGEIPTTSDGQNTDSSSLVSGEGISLSTTGSMNMGGGNRQQMQRPQESRSAEQIQQDEAPQNAPMQRPQTSQPTEQGMQAPQAQQRPQETQSEVVIKTEETEEAPETEEIQTGQQSQPVQPQRQWQNTQSDRQSQRTDMGSNRSNPTAAAQNGNSELMLLCISAAVLLFGIVFAGVYKRR